MGKGRLEAFSDGVMAIIVTIMVLEIKVPHGTDMHALEPLLPVFLSYVLSFINVGLYWNNHHHMFHTVKQVNGKVLWANTHLLFWLSLIPFTTGWMGENHAGTLPVALYGCVLFMCGMAYYMLLHVLIGIHGKHSLLAEAIGKDRKGILSVIIYAIAIAVSFLNTTVALVMYACVACIWFIPDPRIEKLLYKNMLPEDK